IGRRVGGAVSSSTSTPASAAPLEARAAASLSGTTATARPVKPTFPARAASRPPCAHPTSTSRSPIFTPAMLTRRRYGSWRLINIVLSAFSPERSSLFVCEPDAVSLGPAEEGGIGGHNVYLIFPTGCLYLALSKKHRAF